MRKLLTIYWKNGLIQTFLVTEFNSSNHILSMKLINMKEKHINLFNIKYFTCYEEIDITKIDNKSILLFEECVVCKAVTDIRLIHRDTKKEYPFCKDCYKKDLYNKEVFDIKFPYLEKEENNLW